jgi:hypothetical protein
VVPDRPKIGAGAPALRLWSRPAIVLALILTPVAAAYVTFLTPASFGEYNDDAIYLTTAKAIAGGQGYRIISLPGQPAETKYPPFYPFLLSLVWRLYPGFPANLTPMMLLSVLASLASAVLAWIYLARCEYESRWLAIVPVSLAAINLYTAIFSTGVFSEMPYMALSIAALLTAESRDASTGSWSGRSVGGVALGLLMGLAFLTRVTGVSLIAAVGLYFIVRGSRRKALLPIAVATVCVAGWAIWCHAARSASAQSNSLYFTDYFGYALKVIREQQAANSRALPVLLALMVKNNILDLARTAPSMGLGYGRDWLEAIGEPGHSVALASIYVLGLVAILVGARRYLLPRPRLLTIYVGLYLAFHLVLPYQDSSFERYLVPVLPFVILFLVGGVIDAGRAILRLMRKARLPQPAAAAVAAAPLVAIAIFVLVSNVLTLRDGSADLRSWWTAQSAENAPLIDWIKANTRDSDVLSCVHHGMYYLYTGRPATLSFPTEIWLPPDEDSEPPDRPDEKQDDDDSPDVTGSDLSGSGVSGSKEGHKVAFGDDSMEWTAASEGVQRILAENRAGYLVVTASDFGSRPWGIDFRALSRDLIKRGVLKLVYESPDRAGAIYQVIGLPDPE